MAKNSFCVGEQEETVQSSVCITIYIQSFWENYEHAYSVFYLNIFWFDMYITILVNPLVLTTSIGV